MRLLALLFMASLSAWGQTTDQSVAFRLISVEKTGATYRAMISYGKNVGLVATRKGTVYGRYRADNPDHNVELGSATIKEVQSTSTLLEITPKEGKQVFPGDVVYVKIPVPDIDHSTYYYLAQNAVQLTDAGGTPFYTLEEVLQRDGSRYRTEKFLAMQREIHLAGEKLQRSGDKTLVEAGPDAGQRVCDVMAHTDTLRIWYYIYHVAQQDWVNMGQTYSLADHYYAYAKEGDAVTSSVLKTFFVNETAEEREKYWKYYQRKINHEIVKQWLDDANELIQKDDYKGAAKLLEASVYLADRINDVEQSGINSFRIGEVLEVLDDFPGSLQWFKKSKVAFAATKNDEYLAFAQYRVAKGYYLNKRNDLSAAAYDTAIALRRKLIVTSPDRKDLWVQFSKALDAAASVYHDLKAYKHAEALFTEAIDAAHRGEDPDAENTSYWNRGYTRYTEGKQLREAIDDYQHSLTYYRLQNDSSSIDRLERNVAKAFEKLDDYGSAVTHYQEQLKYVPFTKLERRADVNWDLGYAYSKIKNYRNALTNYQASEKIYTNLKDSSSLCTIYNNIGYVWRQMDDSAKAFSYHRIALKIARKLKGVAALTDCYERMSGTAEHFKNWRQSILFQQQRAELLRKENDEANLANAIEAQGDALSNAGDHLAARDKFMEALPLYKKVGNSTKEGDMYWKYAYQSSSFLKKYDLAIENYRIAYLIFMQAGDSANASTMLSNIGQNYWSKLDFNNAIASHLQAIDLATKCKDQSQQATSWSKLASLYRETKNPSASVHALENAITALHHVKDSAQLGDTYHELGEAYGNSKDFVRAFENLNKAIQLRQALRDSAGYASSLDMISGFYLNKSDYTNANRFYQQSLELHKKLKDKSGVIYALANLGVVEQSVSQDYVKSEKYFKEALRLSADLKDDFITGYVCMRMKGLYRSQGKKELAEQYLQKSIDAYRHGHLWKDVASAITEKGYDAYYVSGDTKVALALLDEAQKMVDTLKNVGVQAYIYATRSGVLRETSEFSDALHFADEGMKLYKSLDNWWGVAGSYIDKGNIFKLQSEYDSAIRCQQAADSIYRKLNFEYARLAPLANLGEAYAAEGNYPKSLDYYQQSLAIMKKAHDLNDNLAIIQAATGESYLYMGNYAEAEKWLSQSLATCDQVGAIRTKAENLGVMGRLKIEEKKFDEAYNYLNEGLTLARSRSLSLAVMSHLNLLGKLEVERKNFDRAKPILEESIQKSSTANRLSTLWESLYYLGKLYNSTHQPKEAKKYLMQSVETIEKIRNKVSGGEEARKLFSSDKNILNVYEALVDVLLQLGETDLAMSYLQKNNEEALREKVRGLTIKFENKDKELAVAQERTMKAKLDGIDQQLANEKALPLERQNLQKIRNLEGTRTVAETDYLKFINLQVNVRPELTKYFNNSVRPVDFKNEKKYIPKDMALLSYLPGETQLYIFIATHDTVIAKVVDIPSEKIKRDITAMLNILQNNLGNFPAASLDNEEKERREVVPAMKQTDQYLKPFEEMYHYLIAPASAEIGGKKRLGIIPTGVLNYIPFQMLGKTLSNGKFSLLINQFAVFYVNSTRILSMPADPAKQYKIIAFANPDKSLPSAEQEVADIKKIHPSASVFVRDEATEDKAKFAPEDYNVMHFATHGNLDYEDFTQSYLTMAGNPSRKEDGKLTLEELWGMDVMSHLNIVVLSACQTAVTRGSNESSPVSPASGFLQNGVKSVVATLWKVDDEATALLMREFYANIKTMDAVDALRRAQLTLSKNPKYAHPYYWAAEILMGDWR